MSIQSAGFYAYVFKNKEKGYEAYVPRELSRRYKSKFQADRSIALASAFNTPADFSYKI